MIFDVPRVCVDPIAAEQLLEDIRWDGKPGCPHCGGQSIRKFFAAKRWRRECRECKRVFNVRTGLLPSDRVHLDPSEILAAIWIYQRLPPKARQHGYKSYLRQMLGWSKDTVYEWYPRIVAMQDLEGLFVALMEKDYRLREVRVALEELVAEGILVVEDGKYYKSGNIPKGEASE